MAAPIDPYVLRALRLGAEIAAGSVVGAGLVGVASRVSPSRWALSLLTTPAAWAACIVGAGLVGKELAAPGFNGIAMVALCLLLGAAVAPLPGPWLAEVGVKEPRRRPLLASLAAVLLGGALLAAVLAVGVLDPLLDGYGGAAARPWALTTFGLVALAIGAWVGTVFLVVRHVPPAAGSR